MQTIIEIAVEQDERQRFLEGLNQDFKDLKVEPQTWQEEQEERALWDKTLLDGVEAE